MDSALSKEEFVDDLAMTSMARLRDAGKSEPIRVARLPTEGVPPGSIYIILKYADDFMAAITANAMVGGIMQVEEQISGSFLEPNGIDAIPQFKESLNQFKRCKKMLMTLPLLKGTVSKSNEL